MLCFSFCDVNGISCNDESVNSDLQSVITYKDICMRYVKKRVLTKIIRELNTIQCNDGTTMSNVIEKYRMEYKLF